MLKILFIIEPKLMTINKNQMLIHVKRKQQGKAFLFVADVWTRVQSSLLVSVVTR